MRIFMPTCNRYRWACEAAQTLLERYWPAHPPLDIVHFENAPEIRAQRVMLIDRGQEAAVQKWIDKTLRYLDETVEEFLLWFLDDYGLCQPVNEAAVARSLELLRANPSLCSVALTWQPTRTAPKTPWPASRDFVTFGKWRWSVNTQAGIWRRDALLEICRGGRPSCHPSIWGTEEALSAWFDRTMYERGFRHAGWNCPEPLRPSAFVDEVDKRGWPIAYNNLMHAGAFDERHREFLRKEGLRS